jgi:hypothetical protein
MIIEVLNKKDIISGHIKKAYYTNVNNIYNVSLFYIKNDHKNKKYVDTDIFSFVNSGK